MQVTITINGERVSRDVEPRQLLVHFIRERPASPGRTGAATPPTAAPAWS